MRSTKDRPATSPVNAVDTLDLEEWLDATEPPEQDDGEELGAELADSDPDIVEPFGPIFVRRMTGRGANGAERDSGTTWHAVAAAAFPSYAPALCGATPGRRGNGWSEPAHCRPVTCPRCRRTLGL